MTQEIKPTYVTFEQAKWLKEKGFDETCNAYFDLDKKITLFNDKDFNTSKNSDMYPYTFGEITLPEQWQVVEWLRVNHGIWISVNWYNKNNNNIFWSYTIEKIVKYPEPIDYTPQNTINSNTPQEAYSAAFDYIKENNLI